MDTAIAFFTGIIIGAAVLAVGILIGLRMAEPNCPTEDSCTADYRNGGWHITEVTP